MEKMDQMMQLLHTKSPPLSSPVEESMDHCDGGFDMMEEEDGEIVIPLVEESTANQLVQQRTTKQLKKCQYTIGWHHGRMNPLPSTWRYPSGLTLIQLINFWLIGTKDKNVPPLANVSPHWVCHFDKNGRAYSK